MPEKTMFLIKATGCDQCSSYLKDVRKPWVYPMIIPNIFSLWSTHLSITRSKNHTKLSRGFWYGGPVPEKSGCCAVYLKNTKLAVMRFCRQRNLWNRVMSQLIDLLSTNKIGCPLACLFIHLFVRSFIRSLVRWFVGLLVRWFVHSFIRLFIQ